MISKFTEDVRFPSNRCAEEVLLHHIPDVDKVEAP